jgi:DNA replication protein DnaC
LNAQENRTYAKALKKYTQPVLLIIDEWLLLKPTAEEEKLIFEIIHKRASKASTVFCSQYRVAEWYDRLGGTDSPLTDSILDRIIHNAYKIDIESTDSEKDVSMREIYSKIDF